MLSGLVVLFSLLVIQAHSEQFNCDVVPFETNEVRGSCCIYPKNNFNRPRKEKINQQLQDHFNEWSQPNIENHRGVPGRSEQSSNYGKTETGRRIDSVTETINSYESSSRRVPLNDRNRPIESYPSTVNKNYATRDYIENNQPVVDSNSRSEDNLNRVHGTAFDRNEIPKTSNVERNQEKADRSIFQSKNGSSFNSINRTGEENVHGQQPHSNKTIPVLDNRNNVNVPETCTKGFAKNANGVCVQIFN